MSTQEEELTYLVRMQKRKKIYLYGSFLLCVLSISLVASSLGTPNWMASHLTNEANEEFFGEFNSGLFQGSSYQDNGFIRNTFNYYTVCAEGKCLFSCASSLAKREQHLDTILNGNLEDLEDCEAVSSVSVAGRASSALAMVNGGKLEYLGGDLSQIQYEDTDDKEYDQLRDGTNFTASTDTEGLLDQGLWGGTIGCLSGGLVFSVIASIFAIINTVTTPVEALTGITGLYVWNGIAAFLELLAMILWLVEFSTHLSHNVLIVDAQQGWTTEGNEVLGISFWLVVVSIIIHIANCGVIAYGTYEPKAKDKIQAPDKATNDILLY